MITSNIKILDLGKINSSPELLLQFKKQADEEISDNQTKKDGFEFLFSDNDDDSDEESTDLELYSDDGEEDLIDVVSEKKQNLEVHGHGNVSFEKKKNYFQFKKQFTSKLNIIKYFSLFRTDSDFSF